ncbi:hypothetical protein M407DRAFT_33528 [Tulasnella calospora MUT 4182]|uniref:Malonyl-CoA:ACP transacylase (MAT) domain-containing protein n=1 Tax=Tulasnella calospora MUT 4182 TaxID=1051891 RepID=A0A0C3PQI1_9AGAM|nr:hypothetical protein M407DRAFT_33528 [Tulasnella calospora MUT 4182]
MKSSREFVRMKYTPMDFAIVTGWQAIMKAIFPTDVDGDLLKLIEIVHETPYAVDIISRADAAVLEDKGSPPTTKAILVETINQRGEKAIMGATEVAQALTVPVFTGQGFQEPGMGKELDNAPEARAVQDATDGHLLTVYDFLIVGIDGTAKTLPLFLDIDVRSPRYAFSHPNRLLFITQFAQTALVVTGKAAFEDMHSKGLVPPRCGFAGHLGNYSASIADTVPIASLVDVGSIVALPCKDLSRGTLKIAPTTPYAALREVVEIISRRTGALLEIVNFNVKGQQYVCASGVVDLQRSHATKGACPVGTISAFTKIARNRVSTTAPRRTHLPSAFFAVDSKGSSVPTKALWETITAARNLMGVGLGFGSLPILVSIIDTARAYNYELNSDMEDALIVIDADIAQALP